MAEAIAALGLASNILQFIDFSAKLVDRFYAFYKSSKDHEVNVPNVGILAKNLEAILQELEESDANQIDSKGHFKPLAKECSLIAKQLLAIFSSLNKANEGKIAAIKTAFKSIWKETDIGSLLKQLGQFREQLVLNLLLESRRQIRNSEAYQAEVLNRMEGKIDKISHALDPHSRGQQLGSRIVDVVVSKLDSYNQNKQKKILENTLIDGLVSGNRQSEIGKTSVPTITQSQQARFVKIILDQLHFSNQQDRKNSILDAHEQTFKWVFDDKGNESKKWAKISNWLSSNHQLYWVTGKAGSGKSTLMKYICGVHEAKIVGSTPELSTLPRHTQYLQSWAPAPLKLLTATHFLWNSGAEMERSQNGLLRSLLYQILSRAPELIPLAIPGRWEALCLFGDDHWSAWSTQDLIDMINSIVAHMHENMRLCLFVDGLDEFDGEPLVLIDMFKKLLYNFHVKLCVSSRPWEVFEMAFNHNPSLRMEALTYDDIKAYVSAEILSNNDFSRLQKREPEYAGQIIENIVDKASGVFLWVRLVVASLVAGFGNSDRLIDLQRRLDMLPPELEKLYDRMIDSLDSFYLEHAAQYFSFMEHSSDYLKSTLLLSFIDDETCTSAIRRKIEPINPEEVQERQEIIRRRINSRTKGLLEVSRPQSSVAYATIEDHATIKIQYLHRTVYDHIRSNAVQARLKAAAKSPFDVNKQICIGIIAYIKSLKPTIQLFAEDSSFWLYITEFMYTVTKVLQSNSEGLIDLIDALDETGSKLAKVVGNSIYEQQINARTRGDPFSSGLWLAKHPCFIVKDNASRMIPTSYHFHGFTVAYGLLDYVKARVRRPCMISLPKGPWISALTEQHGRLIQRLGTSCDTTSITEFYSLLNAAIRYGLGAERSWLASTPNSDMVATLIQIGARVELRSAITAMVLDPAILLAKLCEARRIFDELDEPREIASLLIFHYDTVWPAKTSSFGRLGDELYLQEMDTLAERLRGELLSYTRPESTWPESGSSYLGFMNFASRKSIRASRLALLEAVAHCDKWPVRGFCKTHSNILSGRQAISRKYMSLSVTPWQ